MAQWTTLRSCDGYMLQSPVEGGRVEMTLRRDGHARVSTVPRQRRTPQVFEAQVAPWVLEGITVGLTESGFPGLRTYVIPAGTRITLLSLALPGCLVQAWVTPMHRNEAPALHRAMTMLEAIAHSASHGMLGQPAPFEFAVLV